MSAPVRASLPQTQFTDSEGQPIANGFLSIRINEDAQVPVLLLQLVAGRAVQIPLDEDGNITGSGVTFLYPNSELSPDDTVYLLSVYSALGQLVSDDVVIVTSGGSFGFGVSFGSSFAS
jgi:hypothetical protein